MGFLQRLFGKGGADSTADDARAHYIYAACGRCGAFVHTRIDLRNDLSPADDGGYIIRKTLVDDRCFQRMEATIRFNERRQPVDQQVEGGRLLSREEYDSREQEA